MRSTRNSNPGLPRIRNSARSSEAVVGYAKFGLASGRGEPAVVPGSSAIGRRERSSAVKKQMFEDLLASIREAGEILRGRRKPSRRTVIRASGVRVIRERTSLSQSEFAGLIGVSVKTLQNWEQDRRRPTGPAAALLSIIEHDPVLAVKAIHRV